MKRFCIGRAHLRTRLSRALALGAAAALAMGTLPAAAAEPIGDGVAPTCDEAYYATLDYYGNLTNGSVVKSYALNGATKVTDYGTYDTVNNLTDGTEPTVKNGATTFNFGDAAPDHFYFEGITAQPFAALPWTVSLSYQLNGVPTRAEDLAGKTGVVTIALDIVPNENTSDYAKNNYTLEALTMFNQDDILSLKAEGAQVQLVGNLRAVLFLALPGEEEHFTIEVGSNSFTFSGMTFLMVPATLKQLDQIADLADKKQDIEDDYDKLNGSLDTLLNSLDGMSGSLRETANGLDQLNEARDIISSGKGDVYSKADAALGDLDALNESLDKIPGRLDTASQAVDDTTETLNDVSATAADLQERLDDVRDCMERLRDDLNDINKKTGPLQSDLTQLGKDSAALKKALSGFTGELEALNIQIGGENITVQGMTMQELNAMTEQAQTLENVYGAVGQGDELSFQQFLYAMCLIQYNQMTDEEKAAAGGSAQSYAQTSSTGLYQVYVTGYQAYLATPGLPEEAQSRAAYKAYLASVQDGGQKAGAYAKAESLANAYAAATGADIAHGSDMDFSEFLTAVLLTQGKSLASAKALANLYETNKTGLLAQLSALCDTLGTVNSNGTLNGGLTKDLADLGGLAGNTLDDLDDLADVGDDLLDLADELLDEAQAANDLVDKYAPELKDTLAETKTLVTTMTATVSDTHGFLSSFESLLKASGTKLDSGTKKTLDGLADTLRKAANSFDTTDDVRSAKNNISDIIKDAWNDHTGNVDNLLNMDSTAQAVSLTDTRNASPESVQVLIRTQEITIPEEEAAGKSEAAADKGTFWSRLGNLFKAMWDAVAGVFSH